MVKHLCKSPKTVDIFGHPLFWSMAVDPSSSSVQRLAGAEDPSGPYTFRKLHLSEAMGSHILGALNPTIAIQHDPTFPHEVLLMLPTQ